MVDGQPGQGMNAGGGSGGTLIIHTDNLDGHGRLTVSGGHGAGEGGGGSGGRMYINIYQR